MATLPDCSICCEPLASNLGSLKCGHVFHSECILQWLAERSVCPLCKQTVHRSHIRNLFYTAASGPGSILKSSQPISDSFGDGSSDDAATKKLKADISEYRSKLSECKQLLNEKDKEILELNGKARVLQLDQNRHIADIHSFKIKIESLKMEKQDLVDQYEGRINKLERKLTELKTDEAIKKAVEEQNKNGTCDIAAIKRRCKAMSTDTKIKFLFQQLEYTNDLCSQLQQRVKSQEKDLQKSRTQISTLQALDQQRRCKIKHNLSKRPRPSIESPEVISLDDSAVEETDADENFDHDTALAFNSNTGRTLPKAMTNTTSLQISTGSSHNLVSVSLTKPNPVKKPLTTSIAGLSYLTTNRPDRGSTGTGGTSSTFSKVSSIMKDRFRSSTAVSSTATSQDIRAHFKRKQPGM